MSTEQTIDTKSQYNNIHNIKVRISNFIDTSFSDNF